MSDRVSEDTIQTTEMIEELLPAELLSGGDPVLEQNMEDIDRQGYGTPAPAVGLTESAFTHAHMIAPGAVQKHPENDLTWAASQLGYPPPMAAQKSPEAPYGNPGKGV